MTGRAMNAGTAETRSGSGRQPVSAVANGDGPQITGDFPMTDTTEQQAVTVAHDITRNPESIWLSPICDGTAHHGEGRTWAAPSPDETCEDCGEPWVKYVRVDLASVSSASAETCALDWRLIAKAAGEHGVRYRTNAAMAKFLAAVASPEPVPATNQAGEVAKGLEAIRYQFELIAATHPHDQPAYVDGARPFSAGDLPQMIEHLTAAIAALATQPATSQEGEGELDWRKIAKAAGEHGVRYRTNTALERFLSEIAATPTPPTLSEDTTQTFDLVWTAAARPPVHPEPMTGRQTFTSFERAMRFMGNQPDDAQFVSLHGNLTRRYDRSDDARAALAQVKAS